MNPLTRDEVIDMLTNYNSCLARKCYLEIELMRLQQINAQVTSNAIATESLGAQQYSGMPHGSGISDPTARIGGKFADGYLPNYILDLRDDIESMRVEFREKNHVVKCVNSWLLALDHKERFAIENQLIGGMTWHEVGVAYEMFYGVSPGKRAWTETKRSALDKIMKVVSAKPGEKFTLRGICPESAS